ncbi:M20/M25/M40 family metallo-hydrolase [Sphingomonas sp. So64.6b]|nr:M20/M25/M40 family metallo-hydrolase [Sphingomonas sp. So64.6b]
MAAAPPPDEKSDEKVAAALRDRAVAGGNVAMEVVSELTTRFGARPAGSVSERASAEWLAVRLRSFGFRNVKVHRYPITGWTRGMESAEIVGPNPQSLIATALGGSPATPAGGVEGDVVLFDSLDALKLAPVGSLTGKIAMITQAMPNAMRGYGYGQVGPARAFGPSEAAKRGAVAFLLRSLATGSERFAHTGSTRYVDGVVAIPSFALAVPDAEQVERLAKLGEAVRLRLFSSAAYVPGAMTSQVSGDIMGSGAADEIVLLGAHLDSWDLGTGAIDDGAGVAIATAAAKLIGEQKRKARRTVRVVLYGSEEVTQPGAADVSGRAYSDTPGLAIDKHVLAMESDSGADRVYALSLPKGVDASPFAEAAMRVLTPLRIVRSRDGPGSGGVDIGPLVARGVPTFVLEQDMGRYFAYHHTANDTLDKIEPDALNQNVAALASLVWLAADSDVDFRALATAKDPVR